MAIDFGGGQAESWIRTLKMEWVAFAMLMSNHGSGVIQGSYAN
jgi:hypothetical protein